MQANVPASCAAKARLRDIKPAPLKPNSSSPAAGHGTLLSEGHALRIVPLPISEIRPYTRNPRTHPRAQLEKLAANIREFGFLIPILVDSENRIIAGHARFQAAKRLGLTCVPTIEVAHLSEPHVRAFRIADNRLAELATWDKCALTFELKTLSELDLNFDLEITGFELAEVELLIEGAEQGSEPDGADEIPELNKNMSPISQVGDLWLLGEHRLLCADPLQAENFERLLVGERAQMVFLDPPHNLSIKGPVGGKGKTGNAKSVMASGEMSVNALTTFLAGALANLAACCVDGALLYSCMDWCHAYELQTAGREAGLELLELCVWNRDRVRRGSLYGSKHELVFVFKNGPAPHINNIEPGQYRRYRTNVWDYPEVTTSRDVGLEELAMHTAVKPVALVADAIKDCTKRGHIILAAFAGSGSTIVAAQKTGRRGYAIELDPRHVDVAIRQWQRFTGKRAIHADSGLAFDEIARDASVEPSPPRRITSETGHGA